MYLGPANYDFTGTRSIAIYKDVADLPSSPVTPSPINGDSDEEKAKDRDEEAKVTVSVRSLNLDRSPDGSELEDKEVLEETFKRATRYSVLLTLIVAILGTLNLCFLAAYLD